MAKTPMENHNLHSQGAAGYPVPHFTRIGGMFGADVIASISIAPRGFSLAARGHFMLSGHVAFPKQIRRVLVDATEILARLNEGMVFLERGQPQERRALTLNS